MYISNIREWEGKVQSLQITAHGDSVFLALNFSHVIVDNRRDRESQTVLDLPPGFLEKDAFEKEFQRRHQINTDDAADGKHVQ